MPASQRLVFGTFQLDLRDERLWCGPEVVRLRPKPFAVLACLVTQAGRLVTKDALLAAVWPDTVVSEDVLTVTIRQLRRVLGDQARIPRFIETVHGRGYRFIAPVQAPESPEESGEREVPHVAPSPRFRCPPHFVGREAELAQLGHWWTTARQGTRQVGVIAGEPGVGKTALVEAFLTQVAASGACRVGHGQCIEPYGPGEPYLPVLEALGRLGREPEGPQMVSVLRQYAPSWLVQMPALVPPAEREALQHAGGHPAQTPMLRELTEALDALTTECPLVLVLEDLHWSDRATLEWLAYVARRPDPARLLILGTYRPVDVMVHAHPLRTVLTELQQHGQCVELALDYLSDVEVTAYLCQRFGHSGLVADLAPVLHQRTQGNPLFVIAVVDELIRHQVVREGPAGWAMRGGVEALSTIVPATLRALLEQQLAHCSREVQTLLAAASVAGVEFAAAAVAAGLERSEDEIEAECATLAHHGQFLQARGHAEWPDGTVTACFGFRHALYHDLLYQHIPAGRQTRWHARIGARLAQGFGAQAGDLAAALALHCVRGRLLPQAVQYLRQAGDKATARSAYREAVGYFEQALSTLPQLPETHDTREQAIDLRLALGSALLPAGDYGRILIALREAESLAVTFDDPRRLAQVSVFLSNYFYRTGVYDQAIADAQRALALATTSGDAVLHAQANLRLGQAYRTQGAYRQAIDCLGQTVASLAGAPRHERFGQVFLPAVLSRAFLAWCYAEIGRFGEGRALGDEGIEIAEAVEHRASLMYASWGVGMLGLRQGELRRALPQLERAMELCQDTDLPVFFPRMAALLGAAYSLSGRVADAVQLLTTAVEEPIATATAGFQAPCALSLGEAQMLAGRPEEAHALAERTLTLTRAHQERGHEAYALHLLGAIAAHRDPPHAEQAEQYYRQALALADALGMRPLQAHCHLGLGTLYAATGQREQAHTALSTAIALYRAMDMIFWLPQAAAALGQMEGR